nr:hypothetical protein [Leptospira kanakyensis]
MNFSIYDNCFSSEKALYRAAHPDIQVNVTFVPGAIGLPDFTFIPDPNVVVYVFPVPTGEDMLRSNLLLDIFTVEVLNCIMD